MQDMQDEQQQTLRIAKALYAATVVAWLMLAFGPQKQSTPTPDKTTLESITLKKNAKHTK
eukprot:1292084-Rhodomonas_salina.3